MLRLSLLAAAGLFLAMPLAATAQGYGGDYGYGYGYGPSAHQINSACEKARDEKRVVGSVIGALAGGALGVAIADDDDDDHYRGHRGYRGHHGYRGYHGYRGHRGWRGHHRRHDNGNEIAGAVIGGVLGAVVGGELAAGNTDCSPKWNYAEVPPPTRSPYGSAWNASPAPPQQAWSAPPRTANYGNPPRSAIYSNRPLPGELAGGPQPASAQIPVEPAYPAPPAGDGSCTTVQRETELPDGSIVREPVDICQDANGSWYWPDDGGY